LLWSWVLRQGNAFKGWLAASGRYGSTPLIFGGLAFFLSTAPIAFSDMASMLSGADGGQPRWQTYLVDAPAGSVHKAEMAFTDNVTTGSTLADSGITLPTGETVAFRAKHGTKNPVPDEQRINRGQKRGRVTTVLPVAPPKDFSAGSVLHRSNLLVEPTEPGLPEMVFVKPDIKGREVEIATAFHRPPKPSDEGGIPVMLASLVTNENADILATAYAPTEPDYTKTSPFASLLKDEKRQGRFFPPIRKSDHDWAGDALPPHVFSSRQQGCLASGIYFESRGEPVKGQAAVAQVILNRVRNPAYPGTICGVVYQNKRWRNRCQFSFACDGVRDKVRSRQHWSMAQDVAMAVTAGKIWLEQVGSSTHYHAVYVRPKWARSMKRVGRIGLHVFYRTYGGGWS
jgi:spore germination cell wall hydrolase CwlJ-like protein